MPSAQDIKAGAAYVELYLRSNQFTSALKIAEKQLTAMGASIRRMGARLMAVGTGIVGAFAGAAKVFASMGDQIHKMSLRTGIAAESLSQLGFAAEQSGTNLETVAQAIQKMNRRIGRMTAGEGSATQVSAIKELGLSLKELEKMSPEEQFYALADAMKAYGNNAQAAGLAQRAFGTQVDQLLPLFEKGAAGVRELMAEADDLGLTISREDAEAAAAFTDQLNRMARVFKVGIFAAGAAVAPMIAEFAQKMMDAAKIATQWVKEHQDVLKTALKIGGGLAAAGASLIAVGGALSGLGVTLGAVGTAFAFLISPVGLVTAGLGAAALAFRALTRDAAELSDAMGEVRAEGDKLRQSHLDMLDRLDQLAAKQSLTSAEMEEAEGIIGELEGTYGSLGLSVDNLAGNLDGLAAAQDKVNAAMREAVESQLEAELAERQRNVRELMDEMNSTWAQAGEQWFGGTMDKLGAAADVQLKHIDAIIARIRALRAGDTGALTGGPEPEPAAGPGLAGLPSERQAEEAARFNEQINERLFSLRVAQIEDAETREIASIHRIYDEKLKEAERIGADIKKLEEARAEEIAEIQRKHAKERAEAEKEAAKRRADFEKGLRHEVARLEIEATTPEGTERQRRLRELEKEREIERATEAGMGPEAIGMIRRKYALEEEIAAGAMAARRETGARGTFSARAAVLMGRGGMGDPTVKAIEEGTRVAKDSKKVLEKLDNRLRDGQIVWKK